jgi:FMN-dependent NADH-azoreductase
MKKILNIASSVKGKDSFSNQLSTAIIEKLKTDYPGSTVLTRDLVKNPFPNFEEALLGAFYAPEANRTPEQQEAVKHSDQAIKEVMDADILVIAVPMYNFSIPSTLKAWIDHIARRGVTFQYTQNGIEGLVKGKQLILAIASGSVYSEGPMKAYDFTENYLRTILGFIGMTDVSVFRAEGTAMPEFKDTAITKALEKINEFAF